MILVCVGSISIGGIEIPGGMWRNDLVQNLWPQNFVILLKSNI